MDFLECKFITFIVEMCDTSQLNFKFDWPVIFLNCWSIFFLQQLGNQIDGQCTSCTVGKIIWRYDYWNCVTLSDQLSCLCITLSAINIWDSWPYRIGFFFFFSPFCWQHVKVEQWRRSNCGGERERDVKSFCV